MPGNYFPTQIGTQPGPAPVSIVMANGYQYQEFLQSMKMLGYLLRLLEITATDMAQVKQVYQFQNIDEFGVIDIDEIPFAVDPYQVQPNLEIYFKNNQYILNGDLIFSFTINPGEDVKIYLSCIVFDPSDLLMNVKTLGHGYLFINQVDNYLKQFRDKIETEHESPDRENIY